METNEQSKQKPLTPAARAVRWWFFSHKRLKLRAKGVRMPNGCVDPKAVVRAVSAEELPVTRVPKELVPNVSAFRRLRMDARVRLVERFLAGHTDDECLWCAP